MTLDFHKQYDPAERQTEPEKVSTVYVENAATNTFGWVLKAKVRPSVVSELTIDDRRELARSNPPLPANEIAEKAKRVYASGGNTKAIQKALNISPTYAAKFHAAFGRAKPAIAKKNIKNQ
jgi:hypothetical protein